MRAKYSSYLNDELYSKTAVQTHVITVSINVMTQ